MYDDGSVAPRPVVAGFRGVHLLGEDGKVVLGGAGRKLREIKVEEPVQAPLCPPSPAGHAALLRMAEPRPRPMEERRRPISARAPMGAAAGHPLAPVLMVERRYKLAVGGWKAGPFG